MTIRIVQIIAPKENYELVNKQIKDFESICSWEVLDSTKKHFIFYILVTLEESQSLLDLMRSKIDDKTITKIIVSSVETVLPHEVVGESSTLFKFKISEESERVPREELYNQLDNEATLNYNYVFLTLISTLVAALGLLENHIPAVIAAMVIAPMLVPNLAMALAVVLGDTKLLLKSIKSNILGVFLCLGLSIIIGLLWPYKVNSIDLLQRTNVGYSDIALALASGVAAALSLTSRLSAALVGVMVAVALLPPIVATGILIGSASYLLALWAGMLFAVNIVCINLGANLVFIFQGIHPRKWYEKKQAKSAIFWYLLFWVVSLLILFSVIYLHETHHLT